MSSSSTPERQGERGSTGISGYEIVLLGGIMKVGELSGSFTAECPAGKKVLGGGVATFDEDIHVTVSTPVDNGEDWAVTAETYSGTAIKAVSSVNIRIACAFVDLAVAD